MALQKQPVPINFSQGYNQKVDPKQLPIGKFQSLQNIVFNKIGLLEKRNGFGPFTELTASNLSSLTTYSNSLVALGETLNIFSEEQSLWIDKGMVNQVSLSTLNLVRSSSSQTQVDAYLAPNELSCEVWVDSDGTTKYQVNDSSNGQVLLNPVNLPAGANLPRVFALSSYFIVTYLITITATPHLEYVAIPLNDLSAPKSPVSVSATVKSDTTGYDGTVSNNVLYLAWNGSAGGGAIQQVSISAGLVQSSTHTIAGHNGDLISISVSSMNSDVFITYWDSGTGNAYASILNLIGVPLLAPTLILATTTITHMTTIFYNSLLTIAYEVSNTYPSGVRSDYIQYNTLTTGGTVTSPVIILRSVGLASKLFIQNTTIYVTAVYGGAFQPTYFVTDLLGNIQAKLAYSNGGGYVAGKTLANVSNLASGNSYIPYLFKDILISVSKLNASANDSNIYSQTGVNSVSLNFNTPAYSVEIGSNLNLSGGFLTGYDGVKPTEQEFHLWPEDVTITNTSNGGGMAFQDYFYSVTYEWTDGQGNLFRSAPSIPLETTIIAGTAITFTGTAAINTTSVTVSSTTGLVVGQIITDSTAPASIQPGTVITKIVGLVITISLPTIAALAGDTLQTTDTGTASLVIPTLRLTAKPNVRIVIYRWSTANQVYYQVTSISSPLLNNPAVDTVSYTDSLPDAAIVGNVLLYTTGGVVENIAPPSTQITALFKSRLFLLDAEDTNLLWYSKQVIESTPVEMSDLFTIFVAPTIGVSQSTGPILSLGAMDDKLIIFKKDAAYYITGTGPDNTGANNDFSDPIFVAGTVGCANQKSIILIPNGLMFQSDKGIWLLDRSLGTSYIGAPVEDFTVNSTVLSAVSVPGTNQVRFTLDSGVTLMYDYYAQQWGTFVNIPGVSSVLYNNLHTYLRSDGSVFQETPGLYLDNTTPTVISLTTSWFNITGLQGYQRAYQYYLLGSYLSPHLLQVQTSYDYVSLPVQSDMIQPDNFSPAWGEPDPGDTSNWGSSQVWGGPSDSEQWRVNLERQKCQSLQITINEQYDPSFGVPAGAGLTLSGINLVIGVKSGYPRLSPSRAV
jgi:hypothetical protein